MPPNSLLEWFNIAVAVFIAVASIVYFFDKLINKQRTGRVFDILISLLVGLFFLLQIKSISILESTFFALATFLFSEAIEDLRQWRKNKNPKKEHGESDR